MRPSVQRICEVLKSVDTEKYDPLVRQHHGQVVLPLVEELEAIDKEHTRYHSAIGRALDAMIDGQMDDACSILRGALDA